MDFRRDQLLERLEGIEWWDLVPSPHFTSSDARRSTTATKGAMATMRHRGKMAASPNCEKSCGIQTNLTDEAIAVNVSVDSICNTHHHWTLTQHERNAPTNCNATTHVLINSHQHTQESILSPAEVLSSIDLPPGSAQSTQGSSRSSQKEKLAIVLVTPPNACDVILVRSPSAASTARAARVRHKPRGRVI